MNTIEITSEDGQIFVFSNEEQTIAEDRKILNIMTELLGGWEKAAELDNDIKNSYQKHISLNREKFGADFETMQQRFFDLQKQSDEANPEYIGLYEKLYSNPRYYTYKNLLMERMLTRNYAWMQVMCQSPKNYNFLNKQQDFLLKIWMKVAEKKIQILKKD